MERLQIYKCERCGNIVEVLHGGGPVIVCCGEEMVLQDEKTEDSSREKHVPFIEKIDSGVEVRVGQNEAHPMTEEHYIKMIEVIVDGGVYRRYLNPGDQPAAKFPVTGDDINAREYCNIHGLWKG